MSSCLTPFGQNSRYALFIQLINMLIASRDTVGSLNIFSHWQLLIAFLCPLDCRALNIFVVHAITTS